MGKRRKAKRACPAGEGTASVEAPLPVQSPSPPKTVAAPPAAAEAASAPPTAEATEAEKAEQEQLDKDDETYCKYREELVKSEQEAAKEYDKWILTLSGVALGFSLSLVKDFIRPSGAPLLGAWFLYASWCFFGVPVALITFNLQVSFSSARKFRNIMDDRFRDYFNIKERFWEDTEKMMLDLKRNKLIHFFNWVSLLSFLLGIVSLVAFAWCNAKGEVSEHQEIRQSVPATDRLGEEAGARDGDASHPASPTESKTAPDAAAPKEVGPPKEVDAPKGKS